MDARSRSANGRWKAGYIYADSRLCKTRRTRGDRRAADNAFILQHAEIICYKVKGAGGHPPAPFTFT